MIVLWQKPSNSRLFTANSYRIGLELKREHMPDPSAVPGYWDDDGKFWVYGADTSGSAMWDTDLSAGLALVLGAEGKGLRPLVRRACDAIVSVPLAGSVESLNVSVAAAVLLFEAGRQRARA